MRNLKEIRKKIDKIDAEIAKLLRARIRQVKLVGKLKNKAGLPVINRQRERRILAKLKTNYEKEVFKAIIKESKKRE